MAKRGIIIFMILILIILLIWFIVFKGNDFFADINNNENLFECSADSDCVPASCCHANSCISLNKKSDCSGMFCTAVCQGPLDCGAGHCSCVKNKCEVVSDEQI